MRPWNICHRLSLFFIKLRRNFAHRRPTGGRPRHALPACFLTESFEFSGEQPAPACREVLPACFQASHRRPPVEAIPPACSFRKHHRHTGARRFSQAPTYRSFWARFLGRILYFLLFSLLSRVRYKYFPTLILLFRLVIAIESLWIDIPIELVSSW